MIGQDFGRAEPMTGCDPGNFCEAETFGRIRLRRGGGFVDSPMHLVPNLFGTSDLCSFENPRWYEVELRR